MSDTSAGQPTTEPTGPSPAPAPTDPGAPHALELVDSSPRDAPAAPTGPPAGGVAADGGQDSPTPAAPTSANPSPEGTAPSAAAARPSSSNTRRRRKRPAGSRPAAETAVGESEADTESDRPASADPATAEVGRDEDDGAVAPVTEPGALTSEDEPAPEAAGTSPALPAESAKVGDRKRAPERPRIGDTRPARPPAVPVVPVPVTPLAARVVRPAPVPIVVPGAARGVEADEEEVETKASGGRSRRRSGRERRGRPVGRYLMCVHVRPHATQIAVLEGRTLVEHYVSRAADDATQIDGNIYRGRVQNVLPGMEAAFIDIGTPKNAVLYRGDVRYDLEDIETARGATPRIEEMLRPGQVILCQVTKNPIGAKGARLTQEVSLPGRFVVMVPNSTAFGISKRLDDNERKRLRRIVDEVRPTGHGLIVRTAAEGASQDELRHDVERLVALWTAIEAEANRSNAPGLLYREPDLAVRIVREEFNREYRNVVIDDEDLYAQVREYIGQVNPELVDRVEYYDPVVENLPIFERFHVHEQLHKALDRKVWLPSGGSIIIERTEALTVIDVNTGKNVGKSNLEETVYRNNLEAAEEIARQLRLRDIGGIIVIDFIDMEIRENRDRVSAALRSALSRDKTRTQVFDISELGLVEMTRKRVSEGLVESLSSTCTVCGGRGIVLDESLL
jgi:ribonuclease E